MSTKNNGKIPFTVRLFPQEMRRMRALKSKLTSANGGRTVSYSRAVAAMLAAVPPSHLDEEVLEEVKS